jgi:hypothetical protein
MCQMVLERAGLWTGLTTFRVKHINFQKQDFHREWIKQVGYTNIKDSSDEFLNDLQFLDAIKNQNFFK